jgi:hypothetical protein
MSFSWMHGVVSLGAAFGFAIIACSSDPGQQGAGCADGELMCNGLCVESMTDPANCGGCGTACVGAQLCSAGTCSLTCSPGTTQCASSCADVKVDPQNCGTCGTACGVGQICSAGSCVAQCPSAAQTICASDAGVSCVTTTTDSANCGMCGNVCAQGKVCVGGTCSDTCGPGETLCPASAPYCASTQTDQANCGSCGKACATGLVCSAGTCQAQCSPPLTLCGTQCVDTSTDRDNCGGCGKPVCSGATPTCSGGKCIACLGTDVSFGGHCYYFDGSGGACDTGYARAPQTAIASTKAAGLWIGKNYRHSVSSNCCVWTSDAVENYGFGDHCNSNGPFTTNDPILGGAGCTNVMNHNSGQLTFCGN